jgi:type IV secretory pathway VirB4 component
LEKANPKRETIMNYPLFDTSESKLTSLNGEVSYFFDLSGKDTDQMTNDELEQFFIRLKSSLTKVKSNAFTKIYFLNNKCYLNSSDENLNLAGIKLNPNNKPIESFLNNDLDTSIDFFDDYFVVNGEYKKIISFKDLPLEINLSELQELSDYVLIFKRHDTTQTKAKLNFKRRIHLSNLFQSIKNIDSENAYGEAEELLEDVSSHEEALFDCALYIIVTSNTKESLDLKTKELLEKLKAIDSTPRVESIALSSIYLEIFPGSSPRYIRSHLMPATYLTGLLPVENEFIHRDGISFYSRSDLEVFHDLFHPSAHNFNALISGESGQGKSMLANEFLHHYVSKGASAVVLDLGNSFLKNIKYFDGDIFSKTFNPLTFKDSEYLKEFILSFIDTKWSQLEQGRLLKAIKEVSKNVDTFKDLVTELTNEFNRLDLYFEGLWHHFNNDKTNVSNLIYCDLSIYSERMKRPLIIYLIECFKHQNGRRLFIFDECWDLLEQNGDYIAKCFRTFRKYNASAIAISQNIDDFADSKLGRAIIQNTFTKFLFKQKISDSTFIDEYEKNIVNSVHSQKGEYSEFLILSEEIRKIVRFFTTHLKYEIFTSDPTDIKELDSYMDEKGHFLDFKRAIQNFTNIKYEGYYEN